MKFFCELTILYPLVQPFSTVTKIWIGLSSFSIKLWCYKKYFIFFFFEFFFGPETIGESVLVTPFTTSFYIFGVLFGNFLFLLTRNFEVLTWIGMICNVGLMVLWRTFDKCMRNFPHQESHLAIYKRALHTINFCYQAGKISIPRPNCFNTCIEL